MNEPSDGLNESSCSWWWSVTFKHQVHVQLEEDRTRFQVPLPPVLSVFTGRIHHLTKCGKNGFPGIPADSGRKHKSNLKVEDSLHMGTMFLNTKVEHLRRLPVKVGPGPQSVPTNPSL